MDALTKYSMVAIEFALRDAGLEAWERKRQIGLIASSVNGCLETDFRFYNSVIARNGILASPQLFAYTLASSFLGEAAIHFGLDGPSYVLCEQPGAHRMCLQTALLSLSAGECDSLVIGVSDLGSPVGLLDIGNRDSGFLYFVIEGDQPSSASTYGKLSMDLAGEVFFRDHAVMNFWMLANACINPFPGTGEPL
jgi:3-oxoacyl-[acyl-carrier-protein] synthase II